MQTINVPRWKRQQEKAMKRRKKVNRMRALGLNGHAGRIMAAPRNLLSFKPQHKIDPKKRGLFSLIEKIFNINKSQRGN